MKSLYLLITIGSILKGCEGNENRMMEEQTLPAPIPSMEDEVGSPISSRFFAIAFVEQDAPYDAPSDGDLWPSAWSDDGLLYAANGDGKGFDLTGEWSDIVMNRISGHPDEQNISGERLAGGNRLGRVWGNVADYNRKPTGMVSVDGVLYLAVQDLVRTGPNIFNKAPAATILRSDDKGINWQWDSHIPMFKDCVFTTIFFLDYGRDGGDNTFDDYVYAYGLDNNWRDSFSGVVPDPVDLYLARIPKEGLQNIGTWEFYIGDVDGNEAWSAPGDISARKPVLTDQRRRYKQIFSLINPNNLSVISQGSVVYNRPLNRYIYTSWTEFTFEFYESPTPWGPWKLFLSKDFGGYPWNEENFGGYATVIPSKYISGDGTEMWVSSSTFVGGVEHYNFSLRRLWVLPYEQTSPENLLERKNLAFSSNPKEVAPISATSVRNGGLYTLNDGNIATSNAVDSYGVESKVHDFWGYTFSQAFIFNQLVYTTGGIDDCKGGWFKNIRVQLRRYFEWVDVENLQIEPSYTFDNKVKPNTSFTIDFDGDWGDGIRIVGKPGGTMHYTSIAELAVYYK